MTGKRTAHERFPQVIAAAVPGHLARPAAGGHAHGAAITSRLAEDTAIDALLHALVPPRYLGERP